MTSASVGFLAQSIRISVSGRYILDYIHYAIHHYTNKEIAAEKEISENAVSQKYTRLYQSFNVNSKSELVDAFIQNLDRY